MVVGTAVSIALPILKFTREAIDKVNQQCIDKGLPPAFTVNQTEDHPIPIEGNPDYRFEGFGIVVGVPLRLQFWVHYKPDSPEHVEVGRVKVPLKLAEVLNLPRILT